MLRLNSSSLEATLHNWRHTEPCAPTMCTSPSVFGTMLMIPHNSGKGIVTLRSHSMFNSASLSLSSTQHRASSRRVHPFAPFAVPLRKAAEATFAIRPMHHIDLLSGKSGLIADGLYNPCGPCPFRWVAAPPNCTPFLALGSEQLVGGSFVMPPNVCTK